jgi:hypothetical protein
MYPSERPTPHKTKRIKNNTAATLCTVVMAQANQNDPLQHTAHNALPYTRDIATYGNMNIVAEVFRKARKCDFR